MNYFEKHVGDYISDTVSLTMLEDGAYNRLMDQCYQTERPLPLDRAMVYRLARATSTAERKAVDFVVGLFFTETPDGFVQKRIQQEIERYQEKQRKAQASANARWSKSDRNANASQADDANGMRTHCEGNAHQTPDTKHQTPVKKKQTPRAQGALLDEPEEPAPAGSVVPDWLPQEAWEMWDRFRKAKGAKTWTADAKTLSIRTLTQMRADGQDPVKVIEQSIERGWTGLFEIKTNAVNRAGATRHGNFAEQDYHAGISEDGRF